jgi:hypothetical protein
MRQIKVTGDWRANGGAEPIEAFAKKNTWNGWTIPFMDRDHAEQVVQEQYAMYLDMRGNDLEAQPDIDRLWWDGDTLCCGNSEGTHTQRVEPDADGLYDMGLGWTWYEAEAA